MAWVPRVASVAREVRMAKLMRAAWVANGLRVERGGGEIDKGGQGDDSGKCDQGGQGS